MKAKIKAKINLEKRTKLQDVIPLNTPFSIMIEPSDKCNFRCKFCPTSDIKLMKSINGRNYGNMNLDLYKKVIDDLSEFDDNIKIIHLYNQGEPLLNPHFVEMVRYAKKSKYINKVATTTNAALLNEELSLQIIDSNIDRMQISIEGINSKQYFELSQVKIDFDKLVKNIEFFYKNKKNTDIFIKIVGNSLSQEEKNDFYKIFGDICDYIFIENIVPIHGEYEYKLDRKFISEELSLTGEQVQYVNVGPQIFYSLTVNSNGSVSPCCNDWSRKLIVGDANKESIKNIWNGEKIRNLQKLHLMGNRKKHEACASCGVPIYEAIDNIDEYANKLLKKLG